MIRRRRTVCFATDEISMILASLISGGIELSNLDQLNTILGYYTLL